MNTKTEIIRLGRELLLKHGFNGFSYANISEPLHIRNAAIHYHFGSKTDLGLNILEACRRPIAERIGVSVDSKPRKCVVAYVGASTAGKGNDFVDLQILGAMAVDFAGLPPLLQAASRTALTHHCLWLGGHLKAARKKGVFQFNGKPKQCAMQLLMAIQGGHVLNRIQGDPDALSNLATKLIEELSS